MKESTKLKREQEKKEHQEWSKKVNEIQKVEIEKRIEIIKNNEEKIIITSVAETTIKFIFKELNEAIIEDKRYTDEYGTYLEESVLKVVDILEKKGFHNDLILMIDELENFECELNFLNGKDNVKQIKEYIPVYIFEMVSRCQELLKLCK